MAYSPVNISNNVLKRAFDQNVDVSPMKLQKLLYFIASDYAKTSHQPLLNEQFEAWDYGPVVRSVYTEFRTFGAAPIRSYAKDAMGKSRMIRESSNEALRASVDRVWNHAKDFSAVALSRITHLEGSAWYQTFQQHKSGPIDPKALEQDRTYLEPLRLG